MRPDAPIQSVEDAYAHYVLALGLPAEVFWECDCSFAMTVLLDKLAHDGWLAAERERMMEDR